MLRRFFNLISCFLLVTSCTYIEKYTKKEVVQVVDTVIDFSKVDALPVFPKCKEIPSREKQGICFQIEMSSYIYALFQEYELLINQEINDTVFVKLIVDVNGFTKLSSIKMDSTTKQLVPEFDSILRISLQKLPKLEPAIKRDVPVATEFTLPIIIKN